MGKTNNPLEDLNRGKTRGPPGALPPARRGFLKSSRKHWNIFKLMMFVTQ